MPLGTVMQIMLQFLTSYPNQTYHSLPEALHYIRVQVRGSVLIHTAQHHTFGEEN